MRENMRFLAAENDVPLFRVCITSVKPLRTTPYITPKVTLRPGVRVVVDYTHEGGVMARLP